MRQDAFLEYRSIREEIILSKLTSEHSSDMKIAIKIFIEICSTKFLGVFESDSSGQEVVKSSTYKGR